VVEYMQQLYRALALEPRTLRGSVSVEGDAIGATVQTGVNLPDGDYEVVLQAKAVTGSPAADAFRVTTKAYATTDFSFILAAAPGTGNAITFSWILVR
jgi:hypothetical protein